MILRNIHFFWLLINHIAWIFAPIRLSKFQHHLPDQRFCFSCDSDLPNLPSHTTIFRGNFEVTTLNCSAVFFSTGLGLQHSPLLQRASSFLIMSRSGPKSGHTDVPQIADPALTDLQSYRPSNRLTEQYGGEGCLPLSWGKMETGFSANDIQQLCPVKQQDRVPPIGFGLPSCPSNLQGMRSTVKRSYKRACRRAQADGYAWYRGNHIPLEAFPLQMQQHRISSRRTRGRDSQTEHPRVSPQHRLNVMHVNIGGLATSRYEEVCHWALTKDIDILVLSETRWTFTSDWVTSKWNCIHCGTAEDKSDGILIMIRKSVCNADAIGISEYIPGRLVHIRIHFRSRAFDLICCYQFVDNQSLTHKNNRINFWAHLNQCMSTVPNRNSLLIVGDFNCSLQTDGHHVGVSTFTWNASNQTGKQHADAATFQEFLRRYDLTALNSWNARAPPTFCHGKTASRIDFFLMRHADSDCFSKQVTSHTDADFLPPNGPFHIPLICSIKKIPYVYTKKAGIRTCSYQQRLLCRDAWKRRQTNWIQMMQEMDNHLNTFQQIPHDDFSYIDELHNCLMPTLQSYFPKTVVSKSEPNQHSFIESKWLHRRQMLLLTHPTISNMYRAWYHLSRFQSLKKLHNTHIKTLKKQQLHDLLREVDQAAAVFDSFKVFQIINRYTPKQPRKKIRLRREDGTPASSADVQRLTHEYICTRWAGPDALDVGPIVFHSMPFTAEDLAHEIARTPAVKSVASHYVPGVVLKNMSKRLADLLYDRLQQWWTTDRIFVPEQWRNAWIAFLPKPHKMPSKLENLRAIALMEPLGKNVLGLITAQFKQCLYPIVSAWPQFAYIEFRSAGDALRRVAAHCHEVRTLLKNQQRNVFQRAANLPSFKICGGIQMFLDISRAFDEIPRQPLFSHLRTLPIDQQLVTFLGQWHSETAYITTHDRQHIKSGTHCGIRQGCRAAPVLWTGFTNLLFEALANETDATWVRKAVTIYADDIHGGDVFYSEGDLNQILYKFGVMLDVIESHGLHISLNKSLLLISFGGTHHRRIQQSLVQKGDHGYYVCIPRAGGRHSKLPVQKVASYLGAQMSYTNTEMLTLIHRQKAAKMTFFRLRRWLRTRRISQKTKWHLWHSCIYTTLTYGLLATNITLSGLQKLNTFILVNLRQVLGNHSFQTGLTHAQFLQQYNLKHPFAMLLHTLNQLRQLHCQRLMHLTTTDILHTVNWTNLHCLENLIHTAWTAQDHLMDQQIPMHEEVPIKYFACDWCLLRFDSLPNLRRHQTQVHGYTQLRTHEITIASHSLHGLPSCANCHKMFTTWRSFTIHLERNCCQVVGHNACSSTCRPSQDPERKWLTNADLTLLMSKPYGDTVMQAIRHGHWGPLRALTQAHEDISNHCILCGLYHGRPQELNMHIRTHHRKHVDNIFAKAAQLGRSQASISPCFYCHKTFVKQHQCPFWTQIALIMVNMPPTGDAALSDYTLRCEVCRQFFESLAALHTHVFSDHKLDIQDRLPTRDLLGADPVCAHCLSCFADRSAVRHHITRGLCRSFDAGKPLDELPVSPTWTQVIATGDMQCLRQSSMLRLSMTLHCQLCGSRFGRQQDLALHLQTVHADRWMKTQTTLHLLMQVGQLDTKCICNPQTHSSGISHVCPAYRQLSMLAQRVDHELFLPWTFDPAGTRLFLSSIQHHAVIDTILNVMTTRQFSDLWLNQSICHLLSSTCLVCGGDFHPAVLCEHVKAMHFHECTWIPEILPQLIPAFLKYQTCDFQCKSCALIFNLPAGPECTDEQWRQRAQLVQIHAQHHCPIVYQTGLLLTHGLPSRAVRHSDERCGSAGSLQGNGATAADRPLSQRSKRRKRCQEDQERASPRESDANQRCDQVGSTHGKHATAAGCGASTDEKARLLRLLSANSYSGLASTIDVESEGMAHADEAAPTDDHGSPSLRATTECLVPGSGDVVGRSCPPTVQSSPDGRTVANSQDPWSDHGRRQLPLSEMESATTIPDSNEQGSHSHESHAEVHGTTQADLQGPDGGAEISCLATRGGASDSSLDPSDRHETRRDPSASRAVAGVDGMGVDWCNHETPHTGPQQTGTRAPNTLGQGQRQEEWASDPRQRQGQDTSMSLTGSIRQQLCASFEHMTLLNMENWCYANTALLTLTWAMLSCTNFSNMEWGPFGPDLVSLLHNAFHAPIHLPDVSWFQQLLHSWSGEGEQCDPVEFLTHLVTGIHPPGLDWTWERRVQLGTEVSVRDKSAPLTPITLYLDPELSHAGWIRLDTMIHTWANYMGMTTALRHHTPLICFHVDRHVIAGDGEHHKSDLSIGMHGVFSVPVFRDPRLEITWEDYRVVAAVAHLGSDRSGHCRAILRVEDDIRPNQQPFMHLLTDDNAAPTRCWKEPTWFLQNVMCIWLCHVDSLDLYRCELADDTPADPQTSPESLMQLLQHFG